MVFRSCRIVVLGRPAPKGSSRAILINGRARNVPSGSNQNRDAQRSWDANVRAAARQAVGERADPVFVGTPLAVAITFRLTRPAGHWGKTGLRPSAPPYPATKPDLDKLTRQTIDSLIGTVLDDDSRIVRLRVEKHYARPGDEGATIVVAAADAATSSEAFAEQLASVTA